MKQLPIPVRPWSLLTSRSVFICSSALVPPGHPVSWVAPERGIVRTSVMFIGLLVSNGLTRQIGLAHSITHVVNHGTAHRAETGLLLERLGRSPGDLDYAYYCFENP